jgi:hypothetical protein
MKKEKREDGRKEKIADEKLRASEQMASDGVRHLVRAAHAGDAVAARLLARLMQSALCQFGDVEARQKKLFEPLKQDAVAWPRLEYSKNGGPFGKRHELAFCDGTRAKSSEAEIARFLCFFIVQNRKNAKFVSPLVMGGEPMTAEKISLLKKAANKSKKLPPLTKADAKKWWDVARGIFDVWYGKNFERHRDFKGIASSVQARGMSPGEIRRDIKKSVKQAFTSIAQK